MKEQEFVNKLAVEQQKIRFETIKDIINLQCDMAKWGVEHYKNIVSAQNWYNDTFDSLMDCSIEDLHLELERLSGEYCRMFQYISDSNNHPDPKDNPNYPFK